MGAPRVDKTRKTATVEWKDKEYKVVWNALTSREDEECRDEATIFRGSDPNFKLHKYVGLKLRRMVLEIDGEAIDKDSAVWNELEDGFTDALRRGLFPQDREFFRGDSKDG